MVHGVELNGGLAFSSANHNEKNDPHPNYNFLRKIHFAGVAGTNNWVKILDQNFQYQLNALAQKDRTLNRFHVIFICSNENSDSATQGSFLLDINFKMSSSVAGSVISGVSVTPIGLIGQGLTIQATLGYKDTGNATTQERNVKCYVNLPLPYDDLYLTPVYFFTSTAGQSSQINPVGDPNYFNEYQRILALFDKQSSNTPVSASMMNTDLTGYTTQTGSYNTATLINTTATSIDASVSKYIQLQQPSSTTITAINNGYALQEIILNSLNANTTLQSGSTLELPSGASTLAIPNTGVVSLIFLGGKWKVKSKNF